MNLDLNTLTGTGGGSQRRATATADIRAAPPHPSQTSGLRASLETTETYNALYDELNAPRHVTAASSATATTGEEEGWIDRRACREAPPKRGPPPSRPQSAR